MPTIALVVVDAKHSRLRLPSRIGTLLPDNRTVLEHTLRRVARIVKTDAIVVVHPAGQDPLALLQNRDIGKPLHAFADSGELTDTYHEYRLAGRKWALSSWRGGLASMTCWDELLPAEPLAAALRSHGGDSALLLGGDWCLIDPDLCDQALARHLSSPDQMQMCFTQAPPGLAGLAISAKLLDQLAQADGATLGRTMCYNPLRPQSDPIGKDVCVQIEGEIRSCPHRLVYDTPRSAALIDKILHELGPNFADADALTITRHAAKPEIAAAAYDFGPQYVTLEMVPHRPLTGPITPQHYVKLDRPPMPIDLALKLARQLGAWGDAALTLGGLGDALLYPQWDQVVATAHEAGVMGIAIETDLLCERGTIDRLLALPVDLVLVRLNADTAETYAQVNGQNAFTTVISNMEYLLQQRARRDTSPGGLRQLLPWLVPSLVKTPATLADMESFFDRWVHFCGHAVIDAPTTGQGANGRLMPDQSVLPMAPPCRFACRQLNRRLTIMSTGHVVQCDQDWLSNASTGNVMEANVEELWQARQSLRRHHAQSQWSQLPLCGSCGQWHRV